MEWTLEEIAKDLGITVEMLRRYLESKNIRTLPAVLTQLQRAKIAEAWERDYPNGVEEDSGHPEVPAVATSVPADPNADGPWNGDYFSWINSDRWKKHKREEIRQYWDYTCVLCNHFDIYGTNTEVHHRRYRDSKGCVFGRETHNDALVLCRTCHARHHQAIDRSK